MSWTDHLTADERALLSRIDRERDEARSRVRALSKDRSSLLFRATMRMRRLSGIE